MDSCYSSSFQVWKKKEADMMMWCMDRFPTRNGLATSTANLWALSTPPPLKQSAAAVDKLMGVRCNGRGVNSVTYPSFLRIGPNIKMTGAQSGRSWRCSPSHRHSYTGLMSRFQWRWRFFFLLVALVPAALLSIAKRIWLAILIDSKFSTKLHGIGLSQIFWDWKERFLLNPH